MLPKDLQDLLLAPLRFYAINALSELGVFDELKGRQLNSRELSIRLRCNELHLIHLLCVGTTMGLIEKIDGVNYSLTKFGEKYFTDSCNHNLDNLFRHFALYFEPLWKYLPEAIRTSSTQWSKEYQMPSMGFINSSEQELSKYQLALHSLALIEGQECALKIDWSKRRHILDLGGGTGALCLAILQHHEHMNAFCFERPEICEIGNRITNGIPDKERLKFVAGDMFSDPFPATDVILLSLVCNKDKRINDLLKKCYDHLPRGGLLIIADKAKDDGDDIFSLIKLNVLLWVDGEEDGGINIGSKEFIEKLREIGFIQDKLIRTSGFRDYLVLLRS